MKLEITKVCADLYSVTFELDNGYAGCVGTADSDSQARALAVGFEQGVCAVKNMIGIGPRFDGNIKDVASNQQEPEK